jgi:hypothetical protein
MAKFDLKEALKNEIGLSKNEAITMVRVFLMRRQMLFQAEAALGFVGHEPFMKKIQRV